MSEDTIARMIEEAVGVLRPFTGADGRVTFDAPAHIVTAAIV